MNKTPWKTETVNLPVLEWHAIDYLDENTFPKKFQRVLAVDSVGKMHVCIFDGHSHDFLLDTSGLMPEDIDDIVKNKAYEIISDASSKLENEKTSKTIKKIFQDTIDGITEDFEWVYENKPSYSIFFIDVTHWMPLPPEPIKEFESQDDVVAAAQFLTYDVFNAIEPVLRDAIKMAIDMKSSK